MDGVGGAVLEQKSDHLPMIVVDGHGERRAVVVGDGVDVRAAAQEEGGEVQVAFRGGDGEGRAAVHVSGLQVGARFEK